MRVWKWFSVVAAVAVIFSFGSSFRVQAAETVTVFAAASVTNAITDLGNMFGGKGGGNVTPSFAASSTLAKQIENGAPANIFISADEEWMNYLSERRVIVPESRFNLLGNRMVLIAPADSSLKVAIKPGFALAQLLGADRLATGDPDHVPVGKYAKTALEKLGTWKSVESKLARANDARGALALVERGECPLGIVYSTDAAVSKKVKVVGTFPEDSHPPITYPAALVSGKDTSCCSGFSRLPEDAGREGCFYKVRVHGSLMDILELSSLEREALRLSLWVSVLGRGRELAGRRVLVVASGSQEVSGEAPFGWIGPSPAGVAACSNGVYPSGAAGTERGFGSMVVRCLGDHFCL